MKDRVKHWLKNMRLGELSFVPKGANGRSDIVLFKSDKASDVVQAICKEMAEEPVDDFREALSELFEVQEEMDKEGRIYPLMDALREATAKAIKSYSGEDLEKRMRSNVESFLEKLRHEMNDYETSKTGNLGASNMSIEKLEKKVTELEGQIADLNKDKDGANAEAEALRKQLDAVLAEVEKAGFEVKKDRV